MKYSLKEITLITRFTSNSFFDFKKNDLSGVFWKIILNKKTFYKFIKEKYIPYKKSTNSINKSLIIDLNFIFSKIDSLKSLISISNNKNISAIDVFFSYLIFRRIVTIYNEFYKEISKIRLSLVLGVEFIFDKTKSTTEILNDIKNLFLDKNDFIDDFILPIFKNEIEENKLYILKIFWPKEIIEAMIFGDIIKKNTKNSKILLDLSEVNWQNNFLMWKELIKENSYFFSEYLDFFVFYKDFGNSYDKLIDFINGEIEIKFENIISIEKLSIKKLNINFSNLEQRNLESYIDLEEKISPEELLPWLRNKEYIKPKKFFDFLDNSLYFQLLNIYDKKNPFLDYLNLNKKILSKDFNTILNSYFEVSNYLKVEEENDIEVVIYDIVSFSYYYLLKKYYNFIKNYLPDVKLLDNILNNSIDIYNDIIIDIIKNKILIFVK